MIQAYRHYRPLVVSGHGIADVIKEKNLTHDTITNMRVGWRRVCIGIGFFCLSVMMLWWWYCAVRATAPQMIDIDVSGNNRLSTLLLVTMLMISVALLVFSKARWIIRCMWRIAVKYKWLLFAAMMCWQVMLFFALGPATGADAEWIIDYVIDPQVITAKGLNGASYLSNSPNNYLLFFIELGIYKVLPFVTSAESLLLVMRVISALVVDACAVGLYVVAKRYLDASIANIVLLFWCVLLGLSGWCMHPYSDTLCIPFSVINCAFCFWLLSQKTIDKAFLSNWKHLVLVFLFGLNLAVTYNMKPSAVIPVIALVVALFLKASHRFLIALLAFLMLMAGGFLCANISYNHVVRTQQLVPYNHDLSLSPQHYVMMGMTGTGGYLESEYQFTMSYPAYQEKVNANNTVIKQRLHQYGIVGYFTFLLTKFRNFASDGSFGVQRYADNVFSPKVFTNKRLNAIQHNYVVQKISRLYTGGSSLNRTLIQIEQVFYILLVSGLLLNCVRMSKFFFKEDVLPAENSEEHISYNVWLAVSMFGAIIFLLIFESGHSRYLIQFLPIMLLMSGTGISSIYREVRTWREEGTVGERNLAL